MQHLQLHARAETPMQQENGEASDALNVLAATYGFDCCGDVRVQQLNNCSLIWLQSALTSAAASGFSSLVNLLASPLDSKHGGDLCQPTETTQTELITSLWPTESHSTEPMSWTHPSIAATGNRSLLLIIGFSTTSSWHDVYISTFRTQNTKYIDWTKLYFNLFFFFILFRFSIYRWKQSKISYIIQNKFWGPLSVL